MLRVENADHDVGRREGHQPEHNGRLPVTKAEQADAIEPNAHRHSRHQRHLREADADADDAGTQTATGQIYHAENVVGVPQALLDTHENRKLVFKSIIKLIHSFKSFDDHTHTRAT